jgi:murein tripeptide amidase MpaA
MINELTKNRTLNQDILDAIDIYITPIANPDGYEQAQTTKDRLWRKTRSNYSSALGCLGVDPNRNFAYEWGGLGTSADKCSDLYKGPVAFSEPETAAIRDFIESKKSEGVNWLAYFAVHSYSQMWLVPWGWTDVLPPTYDELLEFGTVGVKALTSVHGTQYKIGSVTEILSEFYLLIVSNSYLLLKILVVLIILIHFM